MSRAVSGSSDNRESWWLDNTGDLHLGLKKRQAEDQGHHTASDQLPSGFTRFNTHSFVHVTIVVSIAVVRIVGTVIRRFG